VLFDSNGLPAVVKDPLGNVSQVTYNADGQPVLTSYPGGSAASTTYDSHGHITSQVDPLGNVTQYTTNAAGRLQTLQDPEGNTTNFTYTGQGSLASITPPDGSASSYSYNAQGEVSQSIDALGRATDYTFDSHGRMVLRQNPDGTSIAYGYDANGDLTSVTDASGTITMSYDAAQDITKIVYPNGQFLAYTYNAGKQRTQTVDQTGFTENYAYNNLGQLAEVTDANGNLVVSYTYNLAGWLAGEEHGNGTYRTYTYDANGNVFSLVNFARNASMNSSFAYTYNALNLVTSMTTASGTTTYDYDADGELISVALPTGQAIKYQYDAMGNRKVVNDNGATTTYTSNNTNEYTSVGSATHGYDKDGNLTMTTGGSSGNTTYTYDDENRLIEEVTPTDTWTFQYDALGNLASSTHKGVTTQYLVNPLGLGTVVSEYDGSGDLIANFTYGRLGLASMASPSDALDYYDFDATGNTVGLSGPAGTYVATYGYLPFGEITSAAGSINNPFQYNGQVGVMTTGNGLSFMRQRFYGSSIGRFINRDPIGLAGGKNLYAYADNNPNSFTGPTDCVYNWAYFVYTGSGTYQYVGGTEEMLGVYGDALEGISATAGEYNASTASLLAEFGEAPVIAVAENAVAVDATAASTAGAAVAAEVVVADAEATGTAVTIVGSEGGFAAVGAVAELGLLGINLLIWSKVVHDSIALYHEMNVKTVYASGVVSGQADFTVLPPGRPTDPSYISGPGGFGAQAFVAEGDPLPYIIGFENKPTATAPAQSVTLTQQLDRNLDWTTLQLGNFSFDGTLYQVPVGLTSYRTRIDATSTFGVYVDVNAEFDELTGALNWNFTTIDPTTLD
jgi:RHS repeat-associated protein